MKRLIYNIILGAVISISSFNHEPAKAEENQCSCEQKKAEACEGENCKKEEKCECKESSAAQEEEKKEESHSCH